MTLRPSKVPTWSGTCTVHQPTPTMSFSLPQRLSFAALLAALVFGCDQAAVDTDRASELPGLQEADRISKVQSIVVPPAARRLDIEGDFEYPRRHQRRLRHHGMAPPPKWIRQLSQAESWEDAMILAANASQGILRLPPPAQRRFGALLARTLGGVSHLADLVDHPPPPTRQEVLDFVGSDYAAVATICFVGFNNYEALDDVPNQANNTFAYSPFYRQDCDEADVLFEPTVYDHYHLNFEDTSINCADTSQEGWPFGREVDGMCETIPDHADEHRYLATHTGAGIVKLTARTLFINSPRPFDLISFANVGSVPVKVRYRNELGDWFQFNSLGGNTNWGVSIFDAVEVLITHEGTSLDCGLDQEAGAPGGCETAFEKFLVDEFVIGL